MSLLKLKDKRLLDEDGEPLYAKSGTPDGKHFSIKRTFRACKYSWDGLVNAYKNEQSLWIHGVGSIAAIIMGFILKISFTQWAVLLVSLVVVLAVELLNTGIEAVVDLVTQKYDPLAKIAKDSGSAAAGVAGLAEFIICLFIFVPKIIHLFR